MTALAKVRLHLLVLYHLVPFLSECYDLHSTVLSHTYCIFTMRQEGLILSHKCSAILFSVSYLDIYL